MESFDNGILILKQFIMKRMSILISIGFIFSCNQPSEKKVPALSGKYIVGGFKVTDKREPAGSQLVSATEGTNYNFNFITHDSLRISSKLGIAYFSDSVFQYRVTDQTLYLAGKESEHVIPYKQDGDILNLFIQKNGIDTLSIMPSSK